MEINKDDLDKLILNLNKTIEENYIPRQYIKNLLYEIKKQVYFATSNSEKTYYIGAMEILKIIEEFNYDLGGKIKMRRFEKVNRIEEEIRLPERSTKSSAGYDFYNPEKVEIPPYKLGDNPYLVRTGIKCEMEYDEFLLLVNRSSNPKKKKLVLANGIGIIDAKVL